MDRAYDAYFFDAGGTLFRMSAGMGHHIATAGRELGLELSEEELQKRFDRSWIESGGFAHLKRCFDPADDRRWWRALLRQVVCEIDDSGDVGERLFEFVYERCNSGPAYRLFDDTIRTLATLKERGKCVGVVSNWSGYLDRICAQLGIRGYLDFVLASAPFGAAKPDPRIFVEALERAGVSPAAALHVGDSMDDDVAGANQAGIEAVFLQRAPQNRAALLSRHQPPPRTIGSLLEIL
jgi:putative hydrolase of the HAD superfamily